MPARYYATRFWLSLSLSFLLMTPYLQRYNSGFNRFVFHWNRYDLLALLFSVVLLGALHFLCFVMFYVRGKALSKKISSLIFILIVELVIFSNLAHLINKILIEIFPITTKAYWMIILYYRYPLWALLIAIFAYAIFKNTAKIKKWGLTLCFIASPILPLFFLNGLRYDSIIPDVGSRCSAVEHHDAARGMDRNVYLFIFDEWSYQRSFRERELLSEMTNLNNFHKCAFVFHQAFSPSRDTVSSIPSILFQTDRNFKYLHGRMGFNGRDFQPPDPKESIFHYPGTLGFYTGIVGCYVPYGNLLKGTVDFGESTSDFKLLGEGFLDVAAYHLSEGLLMFLKPFLEDVYSKVNAYLYNQFHVKLIQDTHGLCKMIIQDQSRPTFAVFHYMIPHFPFIFDRNGHKDLFASYECNQENYRGNLIYLDRIIGEIMETLKKAGKFDSALIIMTSDHSWRNDPLLTNTTPVMEQCHVPLFIKMPFQNRPVEIDTKFEIFHLGNFINRYLDTHFDLQEAEQLFREENSFQPRSREEEITKEPGK